MLSSSEVYHNAVANSIPMDHHESDLYLLVTPESAALIAEYEFKANVRVFRSNIDGRQWYDIPFAYLPFWNERKV